MKTGRTQEEIAQELPAKEKTGDAKENIEEGSPSSRPKSLPGAKAAPMPHNIPLMMRHSRRSSLRQAPNWVYEIKWDGVRAICYIEDGHIRMVSRNGNSFDRQYPELSVIPHSIAAETAILDARDRRAR